MEHFTQLIMDVTLMYGRVERVGVNHMPSLIEAVIRIMKISETCQIRGLTVLGDCEIEVLVYPDGLWN